MTINRTRSIKIFFYATFLALCAYPSSADIILDPDPITGVVGLHGESFSSGSIYLYGNQGSSSNDSFSSDGAFSLTVDPNQTFRIQAYLYNFQGTSNSRLNQFLYNLPALTPDEIRELDLRRSAGRIQPNVSIAGGDWLSIRLISRSDYVAFPDERYQGDIYTTTNIQNALQPFPVMDNVTVNGIAVVEIPDGQGDVCSVSVSLENKLVAVLEGQTTVVDWVLDPDEISCPILDTETGTLIGTIGLLGLDGENSTVELNRYYLNINGQNYYNRSFTEFGQYEVTDILVGDYSVYSQAYFKPPYYYLNFNTLNSIEISTNSATQLNIEHSVGTLHTLPELVGLWGFDDINYSRIEWRETEGSRRGHALDYKYSTDERFDLVLKAGTWTPTQLYAYINDYSEMNLSGYTRITPPGIDEITVGVGDYLTPALTPIETSLANVTFQVAQQQGQPAATLERVQISGQSIQPAPTPETPYYRTYINMTSSIGNGGVATNEMTIPVYGVPGNYQLTAVGDGSDGRTYRSSFNIELGAPQNTDVGTDVEQTYEGESGTSTGLTFDNVIEGGVTTVSELDIGPQAPSGFVVYSVGNSVPLFFDIVTTAVFDGSVEVCVTYDDSKLTQGFENNLELGHYTCDENNANCTWEMITSEGYPDVDQNLLCGLTDSFSIFAILEDEYIDSDNDAVEDELDNCPNTPNSEQEDLDGDGVGDACETDTDGDGIIDDIDLCPQLASENNFDLDEDGIGDPCDDDVDGDNVLNTSDNCLLVSNESQVDFDGDGEGDACDTDDDGDTIVDSEDDCLGTTLGEQTDFAGCSSTQLFEVNCSIEGEYRNHGQYVSCVSKEAERQIFEGLISFSDKGAIVSSAAKSDIGKKK